jgi:hypothetical protein
MLGFGAFKRASGRFHERILRFGMVSFAPEPTRSFVANKVVDAA